MNRGLRLDALERDGDHFRVIGYAHPTDDDRGYGVWFTRLPCSLHILLLAPGPDDGSRVLGARIEDDAINF